MLNSWVSPQYDAPSLGSSSVFFMEAPGLSKFPRGLREPLAFAIKIGHQSVSCPGCLIGMLLSLQKDKQKVIRATKKSLWPQYFAKYTPPICGSASPSCWMHSKLRIPACSEGFQRCLGIYRRSGGQAVASEQTWS